MHLTKSDLENTERIKRLNLVNSVTGVKPANLIGTKSNSGKRNLAIFSSVFHLGSNPALIGMICRPAGDVPRNTLDNIQQNAIYTINSVPKKLIRKAHYTSAKFDNSVDEFESCQIEPEVISGFDAPFVKDSPLKMGMHLQELIPLSINNTILIIGSIEHLLIDDKILDDNGYIELDKANIVGIGGLNNYYSLHHQEQHPYARASELPNF
ncbi:MAG: flavin reductase [Fulvivirga sp.]|uniref:flavin reductase family protein n=1 Tax=Fulvivirga sp. TaxID=1931237 RepID=UPI0032EEA22D